MKARLYLHYRPYSLLCEAIKANYNLNVQVDKLVDYIIELVNGNENEIVFVTGVKFFRGAIPSKSMESESAKLDRLSMEVIWTAGYEMYNYPLYPKNGSYTERGVDVALSCHAVQDACERRMDIAILFVSDTDYLPLVKQLKSLGVLTYVVGLDAFGLYTAAPLKREADCLIEFGKSLLEYGHAVETITRKND